VNLIGVISDSIVAVTNGTNVTGVSVTLLALIPLFFALAIASCGIYVASVGLYNAGLV